MLDLLIWDLSETSGRYSSSGTTIGIVESISDNQIVFTGGLFPLGKKNCIEYNIKEKPMYAYSSFLSNINLGKVKDTKEAICFVFGMFCRQYPNIIVITGHNSIKF